VNDVLVLPRGTAGSALVTANNGSALEKFLGRNKKLALICPVLYAADGREVPVNLGEYARQQTKATPGSSSLGGMLFTGLPAEKSADTECAYSSRRQDFCPGDQRYWHQRYRLWPGNKIAAGATGNWAKQAKSFWQTLLSVARNQLGVGFFWLVVV
jgi:hypothetical protein